MIKGCHTRRDIKFFEQCLLQYEARNKHIIPSDDFIVANSNATVRVPFHEVEYVMTDEPHRLALVTLDRIVYFYGALKEIEIIDERLFRCHQSYIVNTKQMSSYDAKQKMIVLKSGKRIPVSRRLVSKVRNMLKGEM